jgi:uncharacterized membrane protein HdeD (DUF308 family)
MVGRDDEYVEPTAEERRASERKGGIGVAVVLLAIALAVLVPLFGGEFDLYFYGGLLLLCGVTAGAAALWNRFRRKRGPGAG